MHVHFYFRGGFYYAPIETTLPEGAVLLTQEELYEEEQPCSSWLCELVPLVIHGEPVDIYDPSVVAG